MRRRVVEYIDVSEKYTLSETSVNFYQTIWRYTPEDTSNATT
jgi:hypothetical protein